MTGIERLQWVDMLRLFAGVSIICMHASFDWMGGPFGDFPANERALPIILHTFFYLARTELFIVISLFLLVLSLDRRPRGYTETIKTQTQRLMIPYIAWMLIYVIFNMFKAWQLGYLVYLWRDMTTIADTWVRWFLLGSIRPQMHFLPTLFALVIFYPLYRCAVDRPILGLMIVPCLYLNSELNLWVYSHVHETSVAYWLRAVRVLTYVGYGFVAAAFYGLLINPLRQNSRYILICILVLFGVWALSVKIAIAFEVIEQGRWVYNYPGRHAANLGFPVVLFGLLMLATVPIPSWVQTLAPYSFGIFLCHPIFLDLFHMAVGDQIGHPSLYVLLKAAFALIGSFALTIFLAKNSALGWLVGLGKLPSLSLKSVLGAFLVDAQRK